MTSFWRVLCLLVLGLALSLGAPLRALAAGSVPVELGAETMPCHDRLQADADRADGVQAGVDPAGPPDCPHCSHGQAGWGCGHCAASLLGAALGPQNASAAALIEMGPERWRLDAVPGLRPEPARVPTPPPKTSSHR